MANPSYLAITSMLGQLLYSGQISSTSATSIYTVPASTTVKIAHGTVCNTSASAVTVTMSLLKSGDTVDGTHVFLSAYPLQPGETLFLKDYIGGAMLATGEAVSITVGTANVIDVILSGAVSS